MPERPTVVFDGKCGFCRMWIDYLQALTGDQLGYTPSPEPISAVRLEFPDGEALTGAHAVYRALAYSPSHRWLLWLYQNLATFALLSNWAYARIAAHRNFGYWATRVLFGRKVLPLSYDFVEWLFVRVIAVIYFVAFVSIGTQIKGLMGANGIVPIERFLNAIGQNYGTARYWNFPMVFWLRHDDGFLVFVAIVGAAAAIVLMLGFLQRPMLALLFILYVSMCTAGQDFLSFQWDMLLLEAGFLAIFLGGTNWIVWLFRLLLFRLMFLSGAVKLLSHDPAWRNLTAMQFHYWTQPLPTPLAWYVNQLPAWFQRASTAGVFFIELLVPWLIFMPRRIRHWAAWFLIFLQVLILTTGNYAFFNLLAIALCLFLFDDQALPKLWVPRVKLSIHPRVAIPVAIMIALLGMFQLTGTIFNYSPHSARVLLRLAAPFGIVNSYGLFAVMTTERPEIQVQGSNDGVTWLDYQFRYRPGDLRRAPPIVAPHQPRLDWQMWFAALSDWHGNPWFVNFMVRLLQASPDVLQLLERDPFAGKPPKYVRALVNRYYFTNFAERRATGHWWKRVPAGQYFPQISMKDVQPEAGR